MSFSHDGINLATEWTGTGSLQLGCSLFPRAEPSSSWLKLTHYHLSAFQYRKEGIEEVKNNYFKKEISQKMQT